MPGGLIYVVVGSTGEYSDHSEWPVEAFLSVEKAHRFVDACTAEGKRIEVIVNEDDGYYSQYDAELNPLLRHVLDPNFNMDYSGFNYFIWAVRFDELYNTLAGD